MGGRDLTSELDRICFVEEPVAYDRSVRICSQNQGVLFPIKNANMLQIICNKFPQLSDPDKEGRTLPWKVGLSYNSNGTAKYSDGTSYNSSTDIAVKDNEIDRCSHDCEVFMSCSDNFLYKLPKEKKAPFLCGLTDAAVLPTNSPSPNRKCLIQTIERKEKVVGNIYLDKTFAVETEATYNQSVQLCVEKNAILLPIKTVEEMLYTCDNFPQIPIPYQEGYEFSWRIGLHFMKNGTGIWADGSTYNPVTDNVQVVMDGFPCSYNCEVYAWCARNFLYTVPKSMYMNPSLCYKVTEQATVLPINGPVIPTSNLALIVGLTASLLISLIFFFFICVCKKRQRRRNIERFLFNANMEALDAEIKAEIEAPELQPNTQIQQDENDEDPYITPNPVHPSFHIHSEINNVSRSHGNQTRGHRSRELPMIPQNRRQDKDSKNEEVRIVNGRKDKVEVDVDPSQQQQQQLQGDDATLPNNDVITTNSPTTSSRDVSSDIKNTSRAVCSVNVTSQRHED